MRHAHQQQRGQRQLHSWCGKHLVTIELLIYDKKEHYPNIGPPPRAPDALRAAFDAAR